MATLNWANFDRLVELRAEKEQWEHNLEDCKRELVDLEQEVANDLLEAGVQSINRNGATVFLRRCVVPAFPAGRAAAVAMLAASPDYGSMVKPDINPQTLGKLVREQEGNPPPEWAGILEEFEIYRIGVRHS